MAGSDKVGPVVPCLFSAAVCRRGDDGLPAFQSFQKNLARELDVSVSAAFFPRRRFGVICKMRVLKS
jgi:hypothetical protein